MRSLFLTLFLCCLLCACGEKQSTLHIVTNFTVGEQDPQHREQIRFTEPQRSSKPFEYEVKAPAKLLINVGGKDLTYTIDDPGVYLLNLSTDTLISVPLEYQSDDQPNTGSYSTPALDSIKANRRKMRGETGTSLLIPTQMERISANTGSKLFVMRQPPRSREHSSKEELPEFYQVQTLKYWVNELRP